MPLTIRWDDPSKQYVYLKPTAPWTWQEYISTFTALFGEIKRIPHTVDLLVDSTEQPPMPPGNALGYFRGMFQLSPENLGIILYVGGSPFSKEILQTFARVNREFGGRFATISSLDEAYIILKQE